MEWKVMEKKGNNKGRKGEEVKGKGGARRSVKAMVHKLAIRPCIDRLYTSVVGCRFGPHKNFGVAPPTK